MFDTSAVRRQGGGVADDDPAAVATGGTRASSTLHLLWQQFVRVAGDNGLCGGHEVVRIFEAVGINPGIPEEDIRRQPTWQWDDVVQLLATTAGTKARSGRMKRSMEFSGIDRGDGEDGWAENDPVHAENDEWVDEVADDELQDQHDANAAAATESSWGSGVASHKHAGDKDKASDDADIGRSGVVELHPILYWFYERGWYKLPKGATAARPGKFFFRWSLPTLRRRTLLLLVAATLMSVIGFVITVSYSGNWSAAAYEEERRSMAFFASLVGDFCDLAETSLVDQAAEAMVDMSQMTAATADAVAAARLHELVQSTLFVEGSVVAASGFSFYDLDASDAAVWNELRTLSFNTAWADVSPATRATAEAIFGAASETSSKASESSFAPPPFAAVADQWQASLGVSDCLSAACSGFYSLGEYSSFDTSARDVPVSLRLPPLQPTSSFLADDSNGDPSARAASVSLWSSVVALGERLSLSNATAENGLTASSTGDVDMQCSLEVRRWAFAASTSAAVLSPIAIPIIEGRLLPTTSNASTNGSSCGGGSSDWRAAALRASSVALCIGTPSSRGGAGYDAMVLHLDLDRSRRDALHDLVAVVDHLNWGFARTTEIVVGGLDENANFDPQLTSWRFETGCIDGCSRFPPSRQNMDAIARDPERESARWQFTPDYRPEPVIGARSVVTAVGSKIAAAAVALVIERDVIELRGIASTSLANVFNTVQGRVRDSTELELFRLWGTPQMPYYEEREGCPAERDCRFKRVVVPPAAAAASSGGVSFSDGGGGTTTASPTTTSSVPTTVVTFLVSLPADGPPGAQAGRPSGGLVPATATTSTTPADAAARTLADGSPVFVQDNLMYIYGCPDCQHLVSGAVNRDVMIMLSVTAADSSKSVSPFRGVLGTTTATEPAGVSAAVRPRASAATANCERIAASAAVDLVMVVCTRDGASVVDVEGSVRESVQNGVSAVVGAGARRGPGSFAEYFDTVGETYGQRIASAGAAESHLMPAAADGTSAEQRRRRAEPVVRMGTAVVSATTIVYNVSMGVRLSFQTDEFRLGIVYGALWGALVGLALIAMGILMVLALSNATMKALAVSWEHNAVIISQTRETFERVVMRFMSPTVAHSIMRDPDVIITQKARVHAVVFGVAGFAKTTQTWSAPNVTRLVHYTRELIANFARLFDVFPLVALGDEVIYVHVVGQARSAITAHLQHAAQQAGAGSSANGSARQQLLSSLTTKLGKHATAVGASGGSNASTPAAPSSTQMLPPLTAASSAIQVLAFACSVMVVMQEDVVMHFPQSSALYAALFQDLNKGHKKYTGLLPLRVGMHSAVGTVSLIPRASTPLYDVVGPPVAGARRVSGAASDYRILVTFPVTELIESQSDSRRMFGFEPGPRVFGRLGSLSTFQVSSFKLPRWDGLQTELGMVNAVQEFPFSASVQKARGLWTKPVESYVLGI